MTKIAFIGAGSLGFTRGLVRDILTFPLLRDATLSLMDVDPERLEFAQQSVQRIVDLGKYSAKVEATLDRAESILTTSCSKKGSRHRAQSNSQM
jgi:alpha-galactosidase